MSVKKSLLSSRISELKDNIDERMLLVLEEALDYEREKGGRIKACRFKKIGGSYFFQIPARNYKEILKLLDSNATYDLTFTRRNTLIKKNQA